MRNQKKLLLRSLIGIVLAPLLVFAMTTGHVSADDSPKPFLYQLRILNVVKDYINNLPKPAPEPEPWPEYSFESFNFYASQAGWEPELVPELRKVVFCESTFRPDVVSSNGLWFGLMQISAFWFDVMDYPFEKWSDPLVNLRVGRLIYQYDIDKGQAPWSQWGCKPWEINFE